MAMTIQFILTALCILSVEIWYRDKSVCIKNHPFSIGESEILTQLVFMIALALSTFSAYCWALHFCNGCKYTGISAITLAGFVTIVVSGHVYVKDEMSILDTIFLFLAAATFATAHWH